MKIVSQDQNTFHVYDDGIKVYDKLPPGYYRLEQRKLTGYVLVKTDDLPVNEKVYGSLESKANKIIKTYLSVERNLGVILSGDKGLGKSLLAKLLCHNLISRGYPTIYVSEYSKGIATFISSLRLDCVLLFDEFDKVFEITSDANDNSVNPQQEFLSLFDGLDNGHKLSVITCNDIRDISQYFINRPGRFHYNIKLKYPEAAEIKTYMKDHLEERYYSEIEKVIEFSYRISLNYDCLRALAFEINQGYGFEEAIEDLNIIHLDGEEFNIRVKFVNGVNLYGSKEEIDLYSDSGERVALFNDSKAFTANMFFSHDSVEFNGTYFTIPVDKVTLSWDDYDNPLQNIDVDSVELRRANKRGYNFFFDRR